MIIIVLADCLVDTVQPFEHIISTSGQQVTPPWRKGEGQHRLYKIHKDQVQSVSVPHDT